MKSTVATDLKLANLLIGIMSHASRYPCTWCVSSCDDLDECMELKTIGNCRAMAAAWEKNGSKKQEAKLFMNCVNEPLFDCDEDTAIIDLIPPPELHLLIGIVNTLYENMLSEFKRESEEWVQDCYVAREVYYSKPSFNGNSSRKLLKNVDVLRRIAEKYGGGCMGYVECFGRFNLVVSSCFSDELNPNFELHIKKFKESYKSLNVKITPKAHALFEHVPHFCKKYNRGLGFYSEQAMESVHADFKKVWTKYKVDRHHPDYAEQLLKAVTEYNSQHI